VVKKLSEALYRANRYPSPDMRVLEEKIADYAGVEPKNVIIGNGSTEILTATINMFIKPNENAVISIPTFTMYEALTKLIGGRVKFVNMGKNFEWNVDGILKAISPKTKLVFICSPNNPTGNSISKREIEKIVNNRVIVIIDEAYSEFAKKTLIELVQEYENVVIIRTFSKAFGLAGLRIGYGVSNQELVGMMKRVVPPFPVNVVALRAAEIVLEDRRLLEAAIRIVQKGRSYLYSELRKIDKVTVYPSEANFFLVNIAKTGIKSTDLVKKLANMGVLIRDCAGFRGLGTDYVRVSVGLMKENRAFIRAFREVREG
jgi:histidinol-phosphate aminotransferase